MHNALEHCTCIHSFRKMIPITLLGNIKIFLNKLHMLSCKRDYIKIQRNLLYFSSIQNEQYKKKDL